MSYLNSPQDAKQILSYFRSFYYDITLSSNNIQLKTLIEFSDPKKVLFVSDVPYAPLPVVF
jgi:hypothetical protein